MQEALNLGFHVFVIEKFATVSLLEASLNASTKFGFFLNQSQGGLLDQLFGGSIVITSNAKVRIPAQE